MAASQSSTIALDLADITEEAYERATGGLRLMATGYDYRTARRSLNILTMEWANRGLNMWTLDQGVIPLVENTHGYQLPADTIDMIDFALRTNAGQTNQTDTPLRRVSVSDYNTIPNKNQRGQPQQLMIQRIAPFPVVTVWPVPDKDTYVMVGWRMRRIHDASAPGSQTMDVPFRFIPALIAGLAYQLSLKVPEGVERSATLKIEYEEQFSNAAMEDRERADTILKPRIARV